MPGIRRKRGDETEEFDDVSDAVSHSSAGSKRARYERDASEEVPVSRRRTGFPPSAARNDGAASSDNEDHSEGVHQPGSIVRVKMVNFVTYTAAEFFPGPSLNMVIGPNGTGKSTLVCAICLGLGWSPINLGRAKELGEFVKHGCEKGEIEIELAAGKNHRTNPIIKRLIRKEGNKTEFWINGERKTQKEVTRLAKSFSIQIDNLCQFLPQDRVAEFAGLSPIELLRETQRAAAPEQMIQWHERLKELRKEEKKLDTEQINEQNHLKTLQAKQTATKADVDRWNERQALVLKQRALDKCRPIIELRVQMTELNTIKAERDELKEELDQLALDLAPARQAEVEMDEYHEQIGRVVHARKPGLDDARRRADNILNQIDREIAAVTDHENTINAEKDGDKKRTQERRRLEGVIARLQADYERRPEAFDPQPINDRLHELRTTCHEKARRSGEIRMEMVNLNASARELQTKKAGIVKQRHNLDSAAGQQANHLKKISPDAALAWEWVKQNRDKFKDVVYGPPVVTCTIPDKSFADAVESRIGLNDKTAFTCTNKEDATLLQKHLLSKEGMSLHGLTVRSVSRSLESFHAPVTQDELRNMGLESFLLDHIQGPDPVRAMLCEYSNLHRTGVSRVGTTIEQQKALVASKLSIWIAGKDGTQVTRRQEYGTTTVTRSFPVPSANVFTDNPVDPEEKRQLDDGIKEVDRDIQELKEQHTALKAEQAQLKEQGDQCKAEIELLSNTKSIKQQEQANWSIIPGKIDDRKAELEQIRSASAQTRQHIFEAEEGARQGHLNIARLTLDHAKAVVAFRQAYEAVVEAEVRLIEAFSEVQSLAQENAAMNRTLQEKQAAYNLAAQRFRGLRDMMKKKQKKTKNDVLSLSEEEKEVVAEFSNLPTLDDLNNEVESVNARLELMAAGNPHAIKAYEDREMEMQRLKERLEELETNLAELREEVANVRGQWEPGLDSLVEKISEGFSHNFQKIGCAGQVGVYKDEDEFENWSIQIQVRFRENESLSILTSQRQSGGERAVSTIFYLMALQDLARSPFRVVDEINQGMDPRNERMVHERMVDIACQERTSQYFLITPKLLNDLKFHPKMKIHCIASGEWMPKEHDRLDFSKLAELAMRVRRPELRV